MNNDSYLTYNKYFSESIFKRKFSEKDVIISGTEVHLLLYKSALLEFRTILEEFSLSNRIILLSSRLSIKRKVNNSAVLVNWEDKMDWIKETNNKWNLYDKIFLDIFPETYVIDKTNTNWVSEIDPPIIGGASPSHYESGYYKEIFKEIKEIIYGL